MKTATATRDGIDFATWNRGRIRDAIARLDGIRETRDLSREELSQLETLYEMQDAAE